MRMRVCVYVLYADACVCMYTHICLHLFTPIHRYSRCSENWKIQSRKTCTYMHVYIYTHTYALPCLYTHTQMLEVFRTINQSLEQILHMHTYIPTYSHLFMHPYTDTRAVQKNWQERGPDTEQGWVARCAEPGNKSIRFPILNPLIWRHVIRNSKIHVHAHTFSVPQYM